MKKLKICLVSLTVSPDTADGEAEVIRALFDYLQNQGHQVKLITAKWNRDLKNEDILQFKIIRKRFFWIFHFNYKIAKYLRKNDFDIIHANSTKAALPVILSNHKNFICTIHDFTPFETKLTTIPLEKLLIKYVSKKAKLVTTVSDYINKCFQVYLPNINRKKVLTLHNGIDDRFKPYLSESQKLKKALGIEGPVLLYVGRIAPYKGVDYIIQAYEIIKKTIPDVNLVICGNPDFTMKNKYKSWVSEYEDVYFRGYIDEEDVPIYYTMADIFITYSSSSEGFGLTPLEALACGTPAICSSISVFKEIFGNNVLYAPPKNPKILAEKIKFLLKDEKLRKDLVTNAKSLLDKYSWEAVGEKLEKIYSNFLADLS